MLFCKSIKSAHLTAKSAANAHCLVNLCLLLAVFIGHNRNAGAAYFHAGCASAAFVGIYFQCRLSLHTLEQRAGAAANDYGGAGSVKLFAKRRFQCLKVSRIDRADVSAINAESCTYILNAYVRCGGVFQSKSCQRVLLIDRKSVV